MQELRTEPRQRRSQQSIDAILDAAEHLIHEQGQVAFTANELAHAASMSIGRVYYWFPDIPSVVAALVDRSVERMVRVLGEAIEQHDQQQTATPLLLQRAVAALCEHVDANPATVALCLTGGPHGPGQKLFDQMAELTGLLLVDRVPSITEPEVLLVSRTAVGITLGMLHGYVVAGEFRSLVRQELVYVLSAWLIARYPVADDAVWTHPEYLLQPARLSVEDATESTPVWPALAPNQPAV